MKNFLQVILIVFFFVGCTQRIGDFTAISTKNIDLDIPSIPACLQLHDIDVIVRIRTLKEKKS